MSPNAIDASIAGDMWNVGTGFSTDVYANTYTFQGHSNTIIDGYLPRYGVSQERRSINI